MTSEQIKKVSRDAKKLAAFMVTSGLSPEDGELALIWIAGLSAGARGASITDKPHMEVFATAWQIGASEG